MHQKAQLPTVAHSLALCTFHHGNHEGRYLFILQIFISHIPLPHGMHPARNATDQAQCLPSQLVVVLEGPLELQNHPQNERTW